MKLPASQRSAMFSRAVRCPWLCRRATAAGRAASSVRAWRVSRRWRSARGAGAPEGSCAACAKPKASGAMPSASGGLALAGTGAVCNNTSPICTVSSTPNNSATTHASASARSSCSIFMASTTTTTAPARTRSPGATCHCTMRAWSGERRSFMRGFCSGVWVQPGQSGDSRAQRTSAEVAKVTRTGWSLPTARKGQGLRR